MSQRLYRLYKAAQNDKSALEELAKPFAGQIEAYKRKLGSEDAAQELWLFFLEMIRARKLDSLRDKSDSCVLSYIARSLKNKMYTIKKTMPSGEPLPSDLPCEDAADDRLCFREALRSLSKDERSLIVALFYDGISVRELAARRRVSAQAIYRMRKRVLKKLRQYFSEKE